MALNTEKVSDDEIYLLTGEGHRGKRICGYIRPGIPDTYPCTNDPGKGTTHLGVGYCAEHNGRFELTPKPKNTYELIVKRKEKKNVLDYIVASNNLETEHYTSVDSEIDLLTGMITSVLSGYDEKTPIANSDIANISKLVEKLAKVKKIKIDSLKKEKLDSEVVAKFLKSVLGIIKLYSPGATSKRIMADIITNVVVPMMNKEEITRADIKTFKEIE